MARMTDPPRRVTAGVDTHADTHVAAAIDSVTAVILGSRSFPATPAGYRALLRWLQRFGDLDAVGVEGTGSYGTGLLRHLQAAGVTVIEVDRPDRKTRRLRGKSDPVDAEAAARAVIAGTATTTPKSRDGAVEAIRALHVVCRSAVKDRTRAINQFKALTLTAPEVVRGRLVDLTFVEQVVRAGRWSTTCDDVTVAATRTALRELARRITQLDATQQRLVAQQRVLIEQTAPALLDVPGVGVDTAARLLITAGDNPQRLRSEAAFAHLCGVAPLPASSGRTTRHRLNRNGDRSANNALWRIAMVRRTCDPRTRDYLARRRAEGLSDRDIMRCLKRYIAREIHRVLTNPPPPAPSGFDIRDLRNQAGLPLRVVADAIDITIIRLSQLERGEQTNPDLRRQAHHWLTTHA
jgi:transposase